MITLICEKCGRGLDYKIELDRYGNLELTIEPCKLCLEQERFEAIAGDGTQKNAV